MDKQQKHEDLRLISCQAWQMAASVDGDAEPQLKSIADAIIKATAIADLGTTDDPKIWAAYQAGLLATAVVKDQKGKALFDRLSEIESLDVGRAEGGRARLRWTETVDCRARKLLESLPANMSDDAKAKRIMARLRDDNNKAFGLSVIKNHLFKS